MKTLLDDLGIALRALVRGQGCGERGRGGSLRRAGSSLGVVVVLATGLGAGAAVFTLLDAVLLRPLPFARPERLVRIQSRAGGEAGRISMREVEELRAEPDLFAGVAAYVPGLAYTVGTESYPEELTAICATRDLFAVLGVAPALGGLWPEEFDHARSFGVVLSHRAFVSSYGADPSIVGRTVTLDGVPDYHVFGVLPEGFDYPVRSDLYRSIFINERFPDYEDRGRRLVVAVARLGEGVAPAVAQQRLDAVAQRWQDEHPDTNRELALELVPLREDYAGEVRPYLVLISAAVALLWLIACANAASLLLVRGIARDGELALRRALGASRARVARGLVLEGLVVALVAAGLGLVGSRLFLALLVRVVRLDLPPWMTIETRPAVLALVAALALVTGVVATAIPAFRGSAADPAAALHGARGAAGARSSLRVRSLLVAAEVALSVVLLVGCGLLVRSFERLLDAEPGFGIERRLTFRVDLTWFTYRDDDLVRSFHRGVLERLQALPGVEAAALTSDLPLAVDEVAERGPVLAEGDAVTEWRDGPTARVARVSAGYRAAMAIPLLRGRDFDDRDGVDGPPVAMVSRALASRLWPDGDAIGRRLQVPAPRGPWREVVAVVGDTRHGSVADPSPEPAVYVPAPQPRPPDMMMFVVRSTVPPRTLERAAVEAVRAVDPDQAVFDVATLRQRSLDGVWRQRVARDLLSVFAAIALVLALVGLYGVVAYVARQRRGELGVRMALGADRAAVVRLLAGGTAAVALAGVAAGVALSLWLAGLLGALLYQVRSHDPLVFALASFLLLAAALAAAVVPAIRASRVDAAAVLRHE